MDFRRKELKDRLKKMIAEGVPIEEIQIPNRSPRAIRKQALRMKLILPLRNYPLTTEQKEQLVNLRKAGVPAYVIASCELLGHANRSENSVQKLCGKLGLAHKNRSRAAKKRKIWRPGEKKHFDDYIIRHSGTHSSEQIAKRFNVVRVTVTNRKKQLGIICSLKKTLALPDVKRKIRAAYMKKSTSMLEAFEAHIAEVEKELVELAKRMRENPLNETTKKFCRRCERWWPRHHKFFFHFTHKLGRSNGTGTIWHFVAPCKLCVAKERHRKNVKKHKEKYGA